MIVPEPLFYRCVCCDAHALRDPSGERSCMLCGWRADVEGYSLREARKNTRAYSIMYRPSDERFARLRHPILGPAGETAIDRVALRQRIYTEFEQYARGRQEPLALPERLQNLLTVIEHADTLYRRER